MMIVRRIVGIVVLLCATLGATVPVANAATVPLPQSLTIEGAYGTAEMTVAVPPRTRPVRFTGRIESSYTRPGRFLIAVNGTVRDRVPSRGGRFRLPLRRADVIDGRIAISLRVRLRLGAQCLIDDRSRATVRSPRLVLAGPPGRPRTIRQFLSPAIRTYVVVLPAKPTADEQAAGLDALLALRHRLGTWPRILLRTTDSPPQPAPQRRVLLVDEDGSGSSAIAVRAGRMFVTGSPGEVTKAAISLADPNITTLAARNVINLAGSADYAPVGTQTTLAELGVAPITQTGIGTTRTTVGIPQAAFGEPVSQMVVSLRGAVTPARRYQQGRVSVRWNGRLVVSRALSRNSQVALDFTVGQQNLISLNDLTVEFQYLPNSGTCREAFPGQLQIDTVDSAVNATPGDSAVGFQRFPQSFPATIPVGFGLRAGPALRNAARLLDAAARLSPLQYTVEIMEKPARRHGALITGATLTQAQDLGAPLPDQQNLAAFPPGRAVPYAALQAFTSAGDDLIVLSAEPVRPARTLANWPAAQKGGWAGLEGQVYVKARSMGAPDLFEVSGDGSSGTRSVWFTVAAVVVLALLILLAVGAALRLRKR